MPVKLDEGFDFSLFLEDLVLRAADEPDAAAHAPAAPRRRARAARRARRGAAGLGRLAHRRHDGRVPPARADPVGRGRARTPRGGARARRTPSARRRSRTTTRACRASRSATSTTPPRSSRGCCSALERIDELERIAGRLPGRGRGGEARGQGEPRPRRGRRARGRAGARRARAAQRHARRRGRAPGRQRSRARSSCSRGWSGWSAPATTASRSAAERSAVASARGLSAIGGRRRRRGAV